MRVSVAPETGILSVIDDSQDGMRWPFVLDFVRGTAQIDLSGERFEVHPLLWRHKILLARYASASEAFLKRQLLRLCVGEREPHGAREQAALWTLVLWMNVPTEPEPALPFESGLLAQVLLDVCRAMQLKPADLDAREALEVELLWKAAGPTTGMRADNPVSATVSRQFASFGGRTLEAGDITTIRIIPDPTPQRTEPVGHAPQDIPLAASAPDSPESAPPHSVDVTWQATTETGTATRSAEGNRSVAERPGVPLTVPAAVRLSRVAATTPGRFRALDFGNAIPAPAPPLPTVRAPLTEPTSQTGVTVEAAETPRYPEAVHGVVPAGPPAATLVQQPLRFDPVSMSPPTPPTAVTTAIDTEALFEELSDRLEQAAAEMGIDMEN